MPGDGDTINRAIFCSKAIGYGVQPWLRAAATPCEAHVLGARPALQELPAFSPAFFGAGITKLGSAFANVPARRRTCALHPPATTLTLPSGRLTAAEWNRTKSNLN